MDISGKVSIVTGSGQGIGKAIAIELAKVGSKVVLADMREDTMELVKKEIEGLGREVLSVKVDVTKWEEVKSLVAKTIERFGRVDIMVNNAGISPRGKGGGRVEIPDLGEEEWDTVMNVDLKGVFFGAKAVMPFMMKQRSGKIVNMASITGLTGGAGSPASLHYCVAKAGVICLTKFLARELGPYNINVNALAPGRIFTEMAKTSSPEANEAAKRQTPLGRFGEPIDVALGVLYLVGESGNFITGETLVIDGGRVMH